MQSSSRPLTPEEARNKAVVPEHFDLLTQKWDVDAARKHIGDTFTQTPARRCKCSP